MPTKSRTYLPFRLFLLCTLVSALCLESRVAEAAGTPVASVLVETVPARYAPLAQTVRAYGVAALGPAEVNDVNLPFVVRVARLYVSAGQRVKRGELLADVVPDPAAVQAYQQALSALGLAKGELTRTQQLLQQQLATQSQLALAQKTLNDAQAALLAQQRLGALASDAKAVVAPFDGVIVGLTATQGGQLPAAASLMQLARDNSGSAAAALNIALAVEPGDSARIHKGAALSVRALNAGTTASTANIGKVVSVGGAIDQQTQLVNLVAAIPASSPGILPGMRVSADIEVSRSAHWIVPRSVLLHDDKGDYLYQVEAGHAVRVDVRKAVDNGALLGVDGALRTALPVVAVGNYELQQGTAVRMAETAATASVAPAGAGR